MLKIMIITTINQFMINKFNTEEEMPFVITKPVETYWLLIKKIYNLT